jgi:hypothetical protein
MDGLKRVLLVEDHGSRRFKDLDTNTPNQGSDIATDIIIIIKVPLNVVISLLYGKYHSAGPTLRLSRQGPVREGNMSVTLVVQYH